MSGADKSIPPSDDTVAGDDRPVLAVISNYARPDNLNLWRRVADEIPEIRVITAWLYGFWEFKWAETEKPPPQINFSSFTASAEGSGEWYSHPLEDWRKGGRLIRYLRENGARVVVCHGYSNFTTLRVIFWCARNGMPLFIRSDSNIRGDNPRSLWRKLSKKRVVRYIVSKCTGFFAAGEMGRQYFAKYGATPEQIFQVTFEPPWDMYLDVDQEALAALRTKEALTEDRRYMLFNGRFAPVKRLDLLVDAFARIAEQRPDWDLVMVGQGPLEEELRARVPDAHRDRVRWLGFREGTDMRLIYHCCQVNVLPSEYEPWGVVVLEAMVTGEVMVASDVVAAAYELIDDRANGRLFRSGDVDSLTEALLDVTDSATLERYRKGLRPAVDRFRERADPVDGVRRALQFAGVLP